MTLPMAVYFHRITIFALPVNLLILPLLLVLMPAALLTLLALIVWPAAACLSGDCGCTGVALWGLAGSLLRVDGTRRFPHPESSALAIGCVLRPAGSGHRAGDSEHR